MGGHGQSSFPFPRTERGWWVPETSRGVAVKDLPPPPTPLHTAQSHPCLAAGYSCSLPTIPPPQFSMGVCPSTRELPGFAFRMRGPGGEGPREELRGLRQLCTMGACAEAATPSFCLPQQGHSAQLSRSPSWESDPHERCHPYGALPPEDSRETKAPYQPGPVNKELFEVPGPLPITPSPSWIHRGPPGQLRPLLSSTGSWEEQGNARFDPRVLDWQPNAPGWGWAGWRWGRRGRSCVASAGRR